MDRSFDGPRRCSSLIPNIMRRRAEAKAAAPSQKCKIGAESGRNGGAKIFGLQSFVRKSGSRLFANTKRNQGIQNHLRLNRIANDSGRESTRSETRPGLLDYPLRREQNLKREKS